MSDLESALADAHTAGERLWPGVRVPAVVFGRFVAGRVTPAALQQRAGDLYLAAGCAASVPAAQQAFEVTFIARTPQYVARMARPDLVAEVQQLLRIKLLVGPPPRIGTYDGSAPLGAWLRVIAVRAALDVVESQARGLKQQSLDEAGEGVASALAASGSIERTMVLGRYYPFLQQSLEEELLALPATDKALLRMHFIDGLSVDALAPLFKVHRATVARWLVSLRQRIVERFKAKVAVELPVTGSEFRSLMEAVAPELRVSITRLLG
jgi:RNA polymerase sigma-70 factor, ECF subfamily